MIKTSQEWRTREKMLNYMAEVEERRPGWKGRMEAHKQYLRKLHEGGRQRQRELENERVRRKNRKKVKAAKRTPRRR